MQNIITNYELEIMNDKILTTKNTKHTKYSIRNSQFVIFDSSSLYVSDKFVIRNSKFVIDIRIS